MNQLGISRQRMVGASIALLASFALLMAAGQGSARAVWLHETNFCWGTVLAGKSACIAPSGTTHLRAIYGRGEQHVVCVKGSVTGTTKCSSGPGQGVYNDSFPGTYDLASIVNEGKTNNKVYATQYWTALWYADSLGGSFTSDPDISSWGYGRLDVFERGSDNTLWHKGYPASNGGWTGWESLGGSLAGGPSAVSWGYGRIDVVGRASDGSVNHWAFNGSQWYLDNLGGVVTSDPDISSWGEGRLDVFARGTDYALWHKIYNGTWNGWESLGGMLSSGPGAVSWGSNRIDVVAQATDHSLTHWSWNGSKWFTDNLGGNIVGDPDIASGGYGVLDVFARGTDNHLWRKAYDAGGWHQWDAVTDNSNEPYSVYSGPGAVSWSGDKLDVVGVRSDGQLLHVASGSG